MTSSREEPGRPVLRRTGRLLEIVGLVEVALRMLGRPDLQDRLDAEHWPDEVQLARLQSSVGRSQGGYRGRRLTREALGRLEAAEPALRRSGQRVFYLGAVAARGLVLLDAGDAPGALDAADEAVAACESIGIRNRWTEHLIRRLGRSERAAEDPLATMWARYWRHRLTDPRLAYSELVRGWEALLRRSIALGVTEPPSERGLKRLYGEARKALRAHSGFDLADVLPQDVADELVRNARNAVAHEIAPAVDFGAACKVLEPAMRALEAQLDACADSLCP